MFLGIQKRHYEERHNEEGNLYNYSCVLDESFHVQQGFGTETWSLSLRR